MEQKRKANKKNKSKKSSGSTANDEKISPHNHVKLLQDAARKLGVKGLAKRLDAVKCVNGTIVSQVSRF